jgi:Cu/Ag efflux protein CusF
MPRPTSPTTFIGRPVTGMTMGYKVTPPSLLDQIKAGDTVRFTIDIEQKAIVSIEKVKK